MHTSNLQPIVNESLIDIDWEDILETIQEEKCVLFIGASLYQAPGGRNLEDDICEYLQAKKPNHKYIKLYNQDGFYLFKKKVHSSRIIKRLNTYYNQAFPETEAIFEKISRIPFSMIFSLTPDNILARTFYSKGYDYDQDFYFKNRKASDDFTTPSKKKPLIYNLLGNIEEPESLILTHSDFFDYLESVFKNQSMHEDLKEQLSKMERYIFLGLPYEKWYFQLLLRVLSLHSPELMEIERLALEQFMSPNLHKIYTEEFKIEFFPFTSEDFINELYKQCEDHNLLKNIPTSSIDQSIVDQITPKSLKELLARGNFDKTLDQLKIYLQNRFLLNHPFYNEFIVLKTRYNLLKKRKLRGTIGESDMTVEQNQIIEAILNLIIEIDNHPAS